MLKRLFRAKDVQNSQYDYALERLRVDNGQGFIIVRLSDNQRLAWQSLAKSSGLQSFNVAGVSHHEDALQDHSFSPGKPLALVPEPSNPYDSNAIAIYDERRKKHIGYIPEDEVKYFSKVFARGEGLQCLSMWETIKDGRRVGLRVLIVEEDVKLDKSNVR